MNSIMRAVKRVATLCKQLGQLVINDQVKSVNGSGSIIYFTGHKLGQM